MYNQQLVEYADWADLKRTIHKIQTISHNNIVYDGFDNIGRHERTKGIILALECGIKKHFTRRFIIADRHSIIFLNEVCVIRFDNFVDVFRAGRKGI